MECQNLDPDWEDVYSSSVEHPNPDSKISTPNRSNSFQTKGDAAQPIQCDQYSSNIGKGVAVLGQAQLQGNITYAEGNINFVQSPQEQSLPLKAEDFTKYLETAKRNLAKKYTQESAFTLPLPWLENQTLNPDEHFVNVEMQVLDKRGHFVRGQISELSQLFDSEKGDGPKQILIRGEAGYGKSFLCMKIAYDWGMNVQTFPSLPVENNLLLFLRLRDLQAGRSIDDQFLDLIRHNSDQDCDLEYVRTALKSYSGEIMVLLDGYDETPSEHLDEVTYLLRNREIGPQSIFRASIFILTSRPVTSNDFHVLFHRHFRLTGLSKENTHHLVALIFQNDQSQITTFFQFLDSSNTTWLSELSPILLWILCFLHSQGERKKTDNPDELFYDALFVMAKRCSVRDNFNLTHHQINQTLLKIGEYFIRNLLQQNIIFTENDIAMYFEDGLPFFVTNCGVLKKTVPVNELGNVCFEPIHKLLMECLAVRTLNENWNEICDEELGQAVLKRLGFTEKYEASLVLFPQKPILNKVTMGFELKGKKVNAFDKSSFFLFQCEIKYHGVKFFLETSEVNIEHTVTIVTGCERSVSNYPFLEHLSRAFPNHVCDLKRISPLFKTTTRVTVEIDYSRYQSETMSYISLNDDVIQEERKSYSELQKLWSNSHPWWPLMGRTVPTELKLFHSLLFHFKDYDFNAHKIFRFGFSCFETPTEKRIVDCIYFFRKLSWGFSQSFGVIMRIDLHGKRNNDRIIKFQYHLDVRVKSDVLKVYLGTSDEPVESFAITNNKKSLNLRNCASLFKYSSKMIFFF